VLHPLDEFTQRYRLEATTKEAAVVLELRDSTRETISDVIVDSVKSHDEAGVADHAPEEARSDESLAD
jgi:hypothetical protein